MTDATGTAELRPLQVEANGINVIAESERRNTTSLRSPYVPLSCWP